MQLVWGNSLQIAGLPRLRRTLAPRGERPRALSFSSPPSSFSVSLVATRAARPFFLSARGSRSRGIPLMVVGAILEVVHSRLVAPATEPPSKFFAHALRHIRLQFRPSVKLVCPKTTLPYPTSPCVPILRLREMILEGHVHGPGRVELSRCPTAFSECKGEGRRTREAWLCHGPVMWRRRRRRSS